MRLGALFDAHQPRLFRLARRLAGSAEDARDLVQETFLRAARSPESVPDGSSHEEAWLVRVLINICRDRWRQVAVRRFHQPSLDLAPPSTHPESALIARSLVWQALDQLPPRRRAILILYELEGTQIPADRAAARRHRGDRSLALVGGATRDGASTDGLAIGRTNMKTLADVMREGDPAGTRSRALRGGGIGHSASRRE